MTRAVAPWERLLFLALGVGLAGACGGSSHDGDGDGRGSGARGGFSAAAGTSGNAGHAAAGSAGAASGAGGAGSGGTTAGGAGTGGTSGGGSGMGGSRAGTGGSHGGAGGSTSGAGGSTSGAAGASAGAPDEATAEYRACAAYVKARCQRLSECGESYDCTTYELDLCPDYVFGPGSNNTTELISGCADDWKDAPCSVLQTFTAVCNYAPGQFENGEPCIYSSQCQSGVCSGSETLCGSCVPVIAAGAPCAGVTGECDYGTTCDGAVCAPRRPVVINAGDDCELNYINCETGTVCRVDDAGNPKCLPSVPPGGACASSYDCVSYNYCDGTTQVCTPSPSAGMPCAGQGIGACDAASLCDTRTMPLMCVPLAGRGESCFDRPNLTDPHGNCDDGLFCVCDAGEDCNDGVCMQRVGEGEACDEAATACIAGTECRSGKCEVSGLQGVYAELCRR